MTEPAMTNQSQPSKEELEAARKIADAQNDRGRTFDNGYSEPEIAAIVHVANASLRSQLEASWEAIEHDRTEICDAVSGLRKVLQEREWLGEGRGPYEWDDDRWHNEFTATAADIREAMEPLVKIAADLTNSPKSHEEVIEARRNLKAELEASREVMKEMGDATERILRLVRTDQRTCLAKVEPTHIRNGCVYCAYEALASALARYQEINR